MKKLVLIFLSLFAFGNAKSQVSNSFYEYFRETVQENQSAGKSFYTSFFDALKTCIDLRNDKYYTEIKLYNQNGISDSAAVVLIPQEVITKFLEQDYERLFCPNADKNREIMEFYSESACQIFTSKYERIEKRERYKQEQAIMKESMTELVNDADFKQKMKEKAAKLDAAAMANVENELTPYFYLNCPVLKIELEEMPKLLGRNNIKGFVRDQRFDISNSFKYAIENNGSDTLRRLFPSTKDLVAFQKMLSSRKNEIEVYNKGKRIDNIDWPDAFSVVQTFASVEKGENVIIRFQFIYHYKQIATRLFVDKVTFISGADIKDKAAVLTKLKSQLQPPPEMVDPYWKPLPPKPEENRQIH